MSILSHPGLPLAVPLLNPDDALLVKQYILLRGKTGSKIQNEIKYILSHFIVFVNKPNLQDITETDVERYFNQLDARGLKRSTKRLNRAYLNSFFKSYERKARRTNPTYYNPIPPTNECHFTHDPVKSMEEITLGEQEQTFTIDQLITILKEFYFINRKYFLMTTLLTFCGMRLSECLSIRIENVKPLDRYLMTGMEENARKSNRTGDHPLYFCFPEEVANLLQEYLIELHLKDPTNLWLFPGTDTCIRTTSYVGFLNHHPFLFPVKSHAFRRTLETFQLNLTNRVPLHFVELLSNHVISSVVMKHYNKITLADRLHLYDEYLPKEYQGILAFLHTL